MSCETDRVHRGKQRADSVTAALAQTWTTPRKEKVTTTDFKTSWKELDTAEAPDTMQSRAFIESDSQEPLAQKAQHKIRLLQHNRLIFWNRCI